MGVRSQRMVLAEDVFLTEASTLFVAATQYTETDSLTLDDVIRLLQQLGRRFGLQPFSKEALDLYEEIFVQSAESTAGYSDAAVDQQVLVISMTLFLYVVREQVWPTVWESMSAAYPAAADIHSDSHDPDAGANTAHPDAPSPDRFEIMPEPADVPVVGVSAAVVARAARSLFFRNDTSGVGQLCLEELSKTLYQLWHRLGLADLHMTIDDCYGTTVTAQLGTSLELLGHTDLEQIEFGAMMSVLGIDPWLALLPASAHQQLALRDEPEVVEEEPEEYVAPPQQTQRRAPVPHGVLDPKTPIAEWLCTLGMGKYSVKFDGAGLTSLGRLALVDMKGYPDLDAIGVRNRKHQSVLLKAANEATQGWEDHFPAWLPTAALPEPEPEPQPESTAQQSFEQPQWDVSTYGAIPPLDGIHPDGVYEAPKSTPLKGTPQHIRTQKQWPSASAQKTPQQSQHDAPAKRQISPNPRKDPHVHAKIVQNAWTAANAAHEFALRRTAAWENPKIPRVVAGDGDGEDVAWRYDQSRKILPTWKSPCQKTPVRKTQFSSGPTVRDVFGQSRAAMKPEFDHKLITDLHKREARRYDGDRKVTPTNQKSPVGRLMVEQFE